MGRVEQVACGQATPVHSVAEWLVFMARVLTERRVQPAEEV